MNRKTFKSGLLAVLLGLSLASRAESDQPIKILVGFPPGGSTDTVARVLADKMSLMLKQPIIIDNKPGAGGRIAAQALKASAPDGHTYMIAPNATPVFQTLLYPPAVLKYDMLNDFAPVGHHRVLSAGAGRGPGVRCQDREGVRRLGQGRPQAAHLRQRRRRRSYPLQRHSTGQGHRRGPAGGPLSRQWADGHRPARAARCPLA
jgi:hypothetical protein